MSNINGIGFPGTVINGITIESGGSTGPAFHILSDLFDFSATGLADGDLGIWTPTGSAPIILRYKAACTFAGGGTVQAWMTPIAYAGTPVMQAWTNGTESNATLLSRGWTIITPEVIGSITPTGGFQRFFAQGVNSGTRIRCMVGTVSASTRMETIFQSRATNGNGSNSWVHAGLYDGVKCSVFGHSSSFRFGFFDGGTGSSLQNPSRNVTGISVPEFVSPAATSIVRDEGRTVMTSADVNGTHCADYLRNNIDTAANLYQVSILRLGGFSDWSCGMDYRGQVITY